MLRIVTYLFSASILLRVFEHITYINTDIVPLLTSVCRACPVAVEVWYNTDASDHV